MKVRDAADTCMANRPLTEALFGVIYLVVSAKVDFLETTATVLQANAKSEVV
jgi:hypothetical protein